MGGGRFMTAATISERTVQPMMPVTYVAPIQDSEAFQCNDQQDQGANDAD